MGPMGKDMDLEMEMGAGLGRMGRPPPANPRRVLDRVRYRTLKRPPTFWLATKWRHTVPPRSFCIPEPRSSLWEQRSKCSPPRWDPGRGQPPPCGFFRRCLPACGQSQRLQELCQDDLRNQVTTVEDELMLLRDRMFCWLFACMTGN